jgi:hypothetical protein
VVKRVDLIIDFNHDGAEQFLIPSELPGRSEWMNAAEVLRNSPPGSTLHVTTTHPPDAEFWWVTDSAAWIEVPE